MAALHEVRHITLDHRGICHIVASQQHGWVHTLCLTWGPGEVMTEWPLKPRLCRKCRKALKTAKPVNPESKP